METASLEQMQNQLKKKTDIMMLEAVEFGYTYREMGYSVEAACEEFKKLLGIEEEGE